jgi:hypothetical protein
VTFVAMWCEIAAGVGKAGEFWSCFYSCGRSAIRLVGEIGDGELRTDFTSPHDREPTVAQSGVSNNDGEAASAELKVAERGLVICCRQQQVPPFENRPSFRLL